MKSSQSSLRPEHLKHSSNQWQFWFYAPLVLKRSVVVEVASFPHTYEIETKSTCTDAKENEKGMNE